MTTLSADSQLSLFTQTQLAQNFCTVANSESMLDNLFNGRMCGRQLLKAYDWPMDRAILSKDERHQISHRVRKLGAGQVQTPVVKCTCCGTEATLLVFVRTTPNVETTHAHFAGFRAKSNEYVSFTVDHQTPRSLLGANSVANRVVMCQACNEDKGSKITSENLARIMASNGDDFVQWVDPAVVRSVCEIMHFIPRLMRNGSSRSIATSRLLAMVRRFEESGSGFNHMTKIKQYLEANIPVDLQRTMAPYFFANFDRFTPVTKPIGFFAKMASYINAIFKRKPSEGNQTAQPN